MEHQYNVSLRDKLSKIGLSDKEASVYSFLLECEGAFPSVIAKNTGLNRTTVYKILTGLSVKGLVTEYEKSKKSFYQVENPKRLEQYAEMQVTLAKSAKEHLEKIMPTLSGLYKNSPDKPVVRFFEGKEGVLAIYNEQIEVARPYEMLAFSNTVRLLPLLSESFKKSYVKGKAKAGITTRAIVPFARKVDTDLVTFYKTVPKKMVPKVKYLPQEMFTFKADLTLFAGNKVSIINFNEPHFAGTIIEDKTIYNMLKLFFELTWSNLPAGR